MKKFRFFATLALLATLALVGTITFAGWFRWQQYQKSSASNIDAATGATEVIDFNKQSCTNDINDDSAVIPNKLNITIVFKCSSPNNLGNIGIINNNKNKFIEMTLSKNSYLFDKYVPSLKDQLGITKKDSLFKFVPITVKGDMVTKIKVLPVANLTKSFSIKTSLNIECNKYLITVWSVDVTNYCFSQGRFMKYENWSDVNFELTSDQGEPVVIGGQNNRNNIPNKIQFNYKNFGVHSQKLTIITNN